MNTRLNHVVVSLLLAMIASSCMSPSDGAIADDHLPGMGGLAGEVTAPGPFKAAKVLAQHVDRNIIYMSYTAGGKYDTVAMFPGNYEVWVEKNGFESDRRSVSIAAGETVTVDFALRPGEVVAKGEGRNIGADPERRNAQLVPYDELYPDAPIRPVLEQTCLQCHGRGFLGFFHRDKPQWDATIRRMVATRIPAGMVNDEEREALVEYMAEHFGPDTPHRRIQAEVDIPLDEAELAKSQWVEYILPTDESRPMRNLQEVHIDFDGNVWYTERTKPNVVGRLDPRTGQVDEWQLPDPDADPHGMTIDAEGWVYWAEVRGGHLGRLNPETGEMQRFPYDKSGEEGFLGGHTPVVDGNGDVWFTLIYGDALGKWDRETQEIEIWRVPTKNSMPYGLDVGPNGVPVMAQLYGCAVAALDFEAQEVREYATLAEKPCVTRRLGIDADNVIWYGLFSKGRLGKLDLSTGEQKEYEFASRLSEPYDVWRDRKAGVLWISDSGQGGAIVRFDPGTEEFTYYPSPRSTDFPKMDVSSEGHIWYSTRAIRVNSGVGVLIPDKSELASLAPSRDGV